MFPVYSLYESKVFPINLKICKHLKAATGGRKGEEGLSAGVKASVAKSILCSLVNTTRLLGLDCREDKFEGNGNAVTSNAVFVIAVTC